MEIATSQTREKYPLSTKKILKKTIGYSLIWILVLSFVMVPASIFLSEATDSFVLPVLVYIAVMGLTILLTYLYELWYFKVYFYDLTSDFIVIRKGPITPREITIPYERVQDVYVDQDIIDRFFGLYDVHLSSATISSGMAAHIDGVVKNNADGLRNELLQTVSAKIAKTRGTSTSPTPVSVPTLPPNPTTQP